MSLAYVETRGSWLLRIVAVTRRRALLTGNCTTPAMLCLVVLCWLLAVGHGGIYTVTEEVWFKIRISDLNGPGEDYEGIFVVALFGETVPMTVRNFASLAQGYYRPKGLLTYEGSVIHRIVPDFIVQMGDITKGDGTGGRSIFGKTFHDENFHLTHRSGGWVAMANHGPNTNGSQFFILLKKARFLDGRYVVFGKVVKGYDVLETLSSMPTDKMSRPRHKVVVEKCGVWHPDKYELTHSMLERTTDH